MSIIKEFNGLNGAVISRTEINRIIDLAKKQEQFQLVERLQLLLDSYNNSEFIFDIENPAFEVAPQSLLHCIDCEENESNAVGLGKPVSPNDIYDMVTDLMINTIKEVGHLPWQKEWKGSGGFQAKNYVTKKPYSGINFFLLNFDFKKDKNGKKYLVPIEFIQPYYLTFNQIEAAGASLKKGSKGHEVVYYTIIRSFKKDDKEITTSDTKKFNDFVKSNGLTKEDLEKVKKYPILKYYNVYRADDCVGLKFLPTPKQKEVNPIDAAQSIIDGYKNPPKYTFVGDGAFYIQATDVLNMPKIQAFNNEANYYSTFFHEITHSTGVKKRLDRNLTGKKGGSEYAYEELIAELGAVYLCSDSGILFHTKENSAKYLQSWNSRLVKELGDDNKFFLKAAAAAQKAANYILNIFSNDQEKTKEIAKKQVAKTKKVVKPVVKLKPNGQEKTKKPVLIVEEKEIKSNNLIKKILTETIIIDKYRFQNREKLNQLILENIVNNFNDVEFDPLIVWKENNKTYLLAGHHRLQALKILKIKTAPVKYFKGTEAEAIEFAVEKSNSNRSLETPIERAKIYRNLITKLNKTKLETKAKKLEGKNANYILNLAHLNSKGQTIESLYKLSETSDKQNASIIEKIADWIGQAKRNYKILTNAHENEMFVFLLNKDDSKRILNKVEFLQKIHTITSAFDFNLKDPLNLKRFKNKTEGESFYESENKKFRVKLDELLTEKSELNDRIKNPNNSNYINPNTKDYDITMKNYDNKIYKINSEINFYQKKIIELQRNKGKYVGSGNNQVGLFGAKKKLNAPILATTTEPPPVSNNSLVKSSKDLMAMSFDSLKFTGVWNKFMQEPARNMKIAGWGLPKNGKTTGFCQFANYLTQFGNVLYNFSDQGFNKSTQDIWKLTGLENNPRAFSTAVRELDDLEKLAASGDYQFIFIDMISTYIQRTGLKPHEFADRFITKYPNISFILIFEVTKGGNFKGDQGWTHIVDAMVTVEDFVMTNRGRYGVGDFVVWKEGLEKFNPKKFAELYEPEATEETQENYVNGFSFNIIEN